MGVKMELFSPTLGLYPNGLATGVVELLARLFSAARTCLVFLLLVYRHVYCRLVGFRPQSKVPAGVSPPRLCFSMTNLTVICIDVTD